jgi:hypothetical protein
MDQGDINRLQVYLRTLFDNDRIRLVLRGKPADSAEVLMGDEFIGVIYKDDEDGDISFDFNMSILSMDLEY